MSNCSGCGSSTPQPCCQDCVDQNPCNSGCLDIIDAGCIEYNGEDIESLGVESTDKLDSILLAIGEVIADIQPVSYGDFEYGCLSSLNINSAQDFVESTSSLFCQILGLQTPGSVTSLSTLNTTIQNVSTVVNSNINNQTTLDAFETISGLPGPTATATALFTALQQVAIDHETDINTLTSLGATPLVANDSATIDFTTSGAGNHTLTGDVKLSAVANNALTAQVDGIHVLSPGITVVDTATVDLTVSGVNNHTVTAAVKISSVPGNQTVAQVDGIYTPATSASETPLVATDSTSIDFTTSGTNGHNLTGVVKLDPSVNNIITSTGSGLYADSSSISIAPNAISDAQLRDSVANSIIGRSSGSTGDPGDIVAANDGVLRRSGSGTLGFGTLVTGNIGNDQVTFAKLQNVSSATVIGRSSGGTGDPESLGAGSHINISGGILNTYGRTLIGITKFNTSGTWTKPSGCNAVLVYTVAAGGGGGGADADAVEAAVGSSGGSGGSSIHFLTAGLGGTEAVTVGVGGDGGDSGNSFIGQNGTLSSFGAHTGVNGGSGGNTSPSGTTSFIQPGGLGGTLNAHPTGLVQHGQGTTGGFGVRLSATIANGGVGAPSIFGGSANAAGAGGTGVAAFNGTTSDGSDGSAGIVIVYEYS